MVWTGTHGLLQLADSNGNLVLPLILLARVLTICSFSTHSIQTSRLTSTWTTRAIRRFRCPSDKNLQISKKINLGLRFFWKVIVDGKSKRGIAMLGSNNPHAAQTPPCTAIVQEVSWLRWWGYFFYFRQLRFYINTTLPSFVNTVEMEAGTLTACSVEDFSAAVQEFPGGVDTSGGLLIWDEDKSVDLTK